MGIQIISISHKIAPLHVREMFAFTEEQQKHMMQKITEHLEVSECIVLSTCCLLYTSFQAIIVEVLNETYPHSFFEKFHKVGLAVEAIICYVFNRNIFLKIVGDIG